MSDVEHTTEETVITTMDSSDATDTEASAQATAEESIDEAGRGEDAQTKQATKASEEVSKSGDEEADKVSEAPANASNESAVEATSKHEDARTLRKPPVLVALLPIIVMIGFMIYIFGIVADADQYDAAHMPLLCGILVACCVGCAYGRTFKHMLGGIVKRIGTSMEAILILLLVGLLISSFMISGTIPAIIYYGLGFLTPSLFLPVGCILCAVVGMACGSSWTATATIGVAFMTIGVGLGINPALTAGMIISGAYAGDKLSPLSDTTNLAAAVAGTTLFDHVRAMVSTTSPVFLVALVLYTVLGLNAEVSGYDPEIAASIQTAIADHFNVSPVVLIPIVVIIAVCVLRVPGLVGVAISIITGIVFAMVFQNVYSIQELFSILHYGPTIETGNELVDAALAKGGMDHQLWTISLVILAVSFGGALESCGSVEAIFGGIKRFLNKVWQLVGATLLTSVFCDAVMCDQYLGIGIPAPLYEDKYDEMGLSRNMLSRTLEDAGTMWSPLFPWTACGAYQMGVLGLNPFMYFPFAFVNLLSPIYAFVTCLLGRNIFWADGSYTTLLGKTKPGKPAECPDEVRERALACLEERRAAGLAPKVNA